MKSVRPSARAILGKVMARQIWRVPTALALALAIAISLFHDLPALAGTSGPDPMPVVSATSAPVPGPDSHTPGIGCHCLCHMTDQATAGTVVTPVVFDDSLDPPRSSAPLHACAGLPPFRPPRV
jgi:hypothetical protein